LYRFSPFGFFGKSLQNKLEQVKACLSDVQEEQVHRDTEVETTHQAIEQAAAAYVDLLDLVREADETTAGQFKQLRETSAVQIREYRQELDQYINHNDEKSDRSTTKHTRST
jgi:hypothetical protein